MLTLREVYRLRPALSIFRLSEFWAPLWAAFAPPPLQKHSKCGCAHTQALQKPCKIRSGFGQLMPQTPQEAFRHFSCEPQQIVLGEASLLSAAP